MVIAKLCKMERLAVFTVSQRLFSILSMRDVKKDFGTGLEKNRNSKTMETLKKRDCETLVFEVKELQDS